MDGDVKDARVLSPAAAGSNILLGRFAWRSTRSFGWLPELETLGLKDCRRRGIFREPEDDASELGGLRLPFEWLVNLVLYGPSGEWLARAFDVDMKLSLLRCISFAFTDSGI